MAQLYSKKTAFQIAAAAIFASLVFVATYSFMINIPATNGYFNFGEIIIYVSAFLFGPIPGALAGGIGAMIADSLLAPQFALGTLIIKGIEGALVGYIFIKLSKRFQNKSIAAILATLIGGLEMVVGYFIYEQIALGFPLTVALYEIPFNLVQMSVGLVVAVPIMHAVLRVFPQLKNTINQ
ncbi:MAG: ECF transporter S component [Crenarchaeota archaeon]|nr:ECF transporter S component [Thermoproteota archaeon]